MIWILIPVYKLSENLHELLGSLIDQSYKYEIDLRIVIVNHGREQLIDLDLFESTKKIIILTAKEKLWWAGAINHGIQFIIRKAEQNHFIGFLNDDDLINDSYISDISRTLNSFPDCIVGSHTIEYWDVVRNKTKNIDVSCGVGYDLNKFLFFEFKHQLNSECEINKIVTLSGKGSFFSIDLLHKFPRMRQSFFPHYGADYEYFARINRNGIDFRIAKGSLIYRIQKPGWKILKTRNRTSLFNLKSVNSIIAQTILTLMMVRKDMILKVLTKKMVNILRLSR